MLYMIMKIDQMSMLILPYNSTVAMTVASVDFVTICPASFQFLWVDVFPTDLIEQTTIRTVCGGTVATQSVA